MITSATNSQIKNLKKLQKSSKTRKEQNAFVVEGIRMFREIPELNRMKAYATESFFDKNTALFESVDYELVSDSVMKEAADTMNPQGVIAVVRQPFYQWEQVMAGENPCLLLLENLQDPGNLGTIFRTAEGAGITGILMSRETVDLFNPKVIRSTMGSIFRMPFLYTDDLISDLRKLTIAGITSYAAHLEGEDFYQKDYRRGTAFLIGNEGNGLSPEITQEAAQRIQIPMEGQVESLNAGIAAALLMYEALRQRRD